MLLGFLMVLTAAPAQAQDTCRQVREVRALAVREGLDDRALRQLEATYCHVRPRPPARPTPPTRPPAPSRPPSSGRPGHPGGSARSSDCEMLQMMQSLQAIGGGRSGDPAQVEHAAMVACAVPSNEERRSWSNGITMKSSSGSWSYPNGITARSSSGSLSYPNGVTARSTSGSWNYPNGVTARSAAGRWSQPNGLSVDGEQALLSWACEQQPHRCQAWAHQLSYLRGEVRSMEIVAIAWQASGR